MDGPIGHVGKTLTDGVFPILRPRDNQINPKTIRENECRYICLRRYREKALFCLAKVIRYTLDEGKSRVCRYIYGISKIWRAPNEFPVSCEPIMIISSFFGLNGPSVGAVQQKHAFGVDDAD